MRSPYVLLRALFLLHLVALVALRIVVDADDFNNWDLISFLNANSFATLREALVQPEVHLTNPFRFPIYNTGAESVISLLLHRAMSGISLYWSNAVVVAVYDLALLAGFAHLFRLVLRDEFTEAAAWALAGMSTVVLTFMSLSAFNVQAYATIVLALCGCERVLQARTRSGLAMIAVAFLFISQAYPLTFFLPLFCLVWTGARVLMQLGRPAAQVRVLMRAALHVAIAVAVCVLAVEAISLGRYVAKAFWVVTDPLAGDPEADTATLAQRVAAFFEHAFLPSKPPDVPQPGFAPFFVWVSLALAGVAAVFASRAGRGTDEACEDRIRLFGRPVPAPGLVAALAWAALVFFGYMPSLFGNNLKSQRCFFGDVFLVLATASTLGWLARRGVPRGPMLAAVAVLALLADGVYLSTVLAVRHSRIHEPVFDYDESDGIARHDIDRTIRYMRTQLDDDRAGLLLYYPRARFENTTDPTVFYARFLRHFGPFHREHWIFPCQYCDPRYGCPFPKVVDRGCRRKCCYFDMVRSVRETRALEGRRIYMWWFEDPDFKDEGRIERVLSLLEPTHVTRDLGTPAPEKRWHVYELVPRKVPLEAEPRRKSLVSSRER